MAQHEGSVPWMRWYRGEWHMGENSEESPSVSTVTGRHFSLPRRPSFTCLKDSCRCWDGHSLLFFLLVVLGIELRARQVLYYLSHTPSLVIQVFTTNGMRVLNARKLQQSRRLRNMEG
jgi:hypothetical protein